MTFSIISDYDLQLPWFILWLVLKMKNNVISYYDIFIYFDLNCFNILFSFQYQLRISHENICSLKVKVQNLFNRPKQTISRVSANYYIKFKFVTSSITCVSYSKISPQGIFWDMTQSWNLKQINIFVTSYIWNIDKQ